MSLTGAFIDMLGFREPGALRQGAPSYGDLRGPMASKGAHLLLIKGLIDLSRSRGPRLGNGS